MTDPAPTLREATGKAEPKQPRPVTLFTGQWADLPFEEVCRLASGWGYDGLEIACWGDHFDVAKAAEDDAYVRGRKDILERHGLGCWAISNHLNGQAVCEAIVDQRYHDMVNPRVWGDGDPEGVRQRAAEEMKTTARAAAAFGVDTVVGFTGSSIWHYVAMFPPVGDEVIAAGYADFADRWNPIIDVFDEVGVRFAHEVHPSEIAYDYRPRSPPSTPSATGPASASTTTPHTWSGRAWTTSASCGTSRTGSTTSTARTPRSG